MTSHKEKSALKTAGGDVEILRRSFPFANKEEAGLLFVGWMRDLAQYEALKTQMATHGKDGKDVGKDAIEAFYTAVSGGYYFAPPLPGSDGYLGDFLFER